MTCIVRIGFPVSDVPELACRDVVLFDAVRSPPALVLDAFDVNG